MMILDKQSANKKLQRMALEIAERNIGINELIIIGIKESGLVIAQKVKGFLQQSFAGNVILVELSLDKKNPLEITISSNIDFTGKNILLVDDVANSGRTMLYALKPILDKIPSQVQTLALVERTHKQFPIAVDYLGLSVATTLLQTITVDVENGEVIGAYLK